MALDPQLLEILACPDDKGALVYPDHPEIALILQHPRHSLPGCAPAANRNSEAVGPTARLQK